MFCKNDGGCEAFDTVASDSSRGQCGAFLPFLLAESIHVEVAHSFDSVFMDLGG
jgi:hypothetical protein